MQSLIILQFWHDLSTSRHMRCKMSFRRIVRGIGWKYDLPQTTPCAVTVLYRSTEARSMCSLRRTDTDEIASTVGWFASRTVSGPVCALMIWRSQRRRDWRRQCCDRSIRSMKVSYVAFARSHRLGIPAHLYPSRGPQFTRREYRQSV